MHIARITDADALIALERIDPRLVEDGRVTLIGLDAIRERLGERWERRRDQIWSHAERQIARRLKPSELVHRVSETDFIIAFTETPASAALGQALQILAEILTHFLGKAEPSQLRVSTVRDLKNGELACAPLTAGEIDNLLAPDAIIVETRRPPPRPTPPTWLRTPIRLTSGMQLTLTTWPEPVTHVRARRVGVRLARELSIVGDRPLSAADRDRLQPVEQAELDIATLHRARHHLKHEPCKGGLLLLPLSFVAFANSAARARISRALADLDDGDRAALVLDVEDIAAGTPPSRVVEIIGYMRPLARAIMVRAAGTRAAVDVLRDARIQGVSLDLAPFGEAAGQVFSRVKLLRDRSRGVASEVLALGLTSPELATIAAAAGASFYSVRPPIAQPLAATG